MQASCSLLAAYQHKLSCRYLFSCPFRFIRYYCSWRYLAVQILLIILRFIGCADLHYIILISRAAISAAMTYKKLYSMLNPWFWCFLRFHPLVFKYLESNIQILFHVLIFNESIDPMGIFWYVSPHFIGCDILMFQIFRLRWLELYLRLNIFTRFIDHLGASVFSSNSYWWLLKKSLSPSLLLGVKWIYHLLFFGCYEITISIEYDSLW